MSSTRLFLLTEAHPIYLFASSTRSFFRTFRIASSVLSYWSSFAMHRTYNAVPFKPTPTVPRQHQSLSTPTVPLQLQSLSTPTVPLQLQSLCTPPVPLQLQSLSTPTVRCNSSPFLHPLSHCNSSPFLYPLSRCKSFSSL